LIKIYKNEEKKINISALRGCDLEVKKGELVSIIGPSGSGKTTLINILAGLDSPSSGLVEIVSQRIDQLNSNELNLYRKTKISLINQFAERTLLLNISVNDNLIFFNNILESKYKESQSLSNDVILEKLGIDSLKNRIVNTLSGGELTRVALACALAKNVPIILCDEPTGQLDTRNTEKVKELLREITLKFAKTIIVVTHDHRFIEGVDKTYEIQDGRLTSVLSLEERLLLSQKLEFPIKYKHYIDSTRNIRIPDMVYKTLKLSDSGEFALEKDGRVSLQNPNNTEIEEIKLKDDRPKRIFYNVKSIPASYNKNKTPIIKLKNIKKNYHTSGGVLKALDSISVTFYENEIVFVLGPSGSGKTTLLKLISGIEDISEGSLKVLGTDFSKNTNRERAIFRRENMGLVSQHGSLNPFFTVEENLLIKDIYRGKKDIILDESSTTKQSIMSKFQISSRQKSNPMEISGGELQRASLAIAFIDNPKILLLDEPTANLDSTLAQKTIETIFSINNQLKNTILISTHNTELLKNNARIIELSDGKIIQNGIIQIDQ